MKGELIADLLVLRDEVKVESGRLCFAQELVMGEESALCRR